MLSVIVVGTMDYIVEIVLGIIAVVAIIYMFKPRKRPGSDTRPAQSGASSQAHGASAPPAVAASGEASIVIPPGLEAFGPSPRSDSQHASEGHPRSIPGGSASTPALSTKTGEYDVFISHCGVDTKRNFAVWLKEELLNVGVRCFFDDHSLAVGDSAADKMLEAMETATYGVVILSPGFFEREWCMKELQTFERRKRIVPIFLPDFEAVEKARKAAMEGKAWTRFKKFVRSKEEFLGATDGSGNFTGVRLSADDGWWNTCIRKTRDHVLQLLGKEKGGLRLSEDELLVGQDEHLVQLKRLLTLPGYGEPAPGSVPGEVGIVGVKGMGGVGKSTLAKKLYDEPDVREWFVGGICWLEVGPKPTDEKVCDLQRQILRQLCNSQEDPGNPSRGRSLIRDRLRGKRVLICLDDVWESFEVATHVLRAEDLGVGSCILKTTRVKEAVGGTEVLNLDVLPDELALELFCWHAFKGEKPTVDLAEKGQKATKVCGGLPLAIRVLAMQVALSSTKQVFLGEFLALPKHSDAMIQCCAIIKASYDNLPSDPRKLKDAFLLMVGVWPRTQEFLEPKRAAENLAAALYGHELPQDGQQLARGAVRHLVDKSLLSVGEVDGAKILTIHDLVVDVADGLCAGGSVTSRFFREPDYARSVSTKEVGWEHVRLVRGPVPTDILTSAVLSLVVSGSACEFQQAGGTEEGPSRCRLLIVEGGQPATFVQLTNLRCLRLLGCDFEALPNGEALKQLTELRALDLRDCRKLVSLPESLGQLTELTSLDLRSCWALKSLPKSLGQLTGLTALDLNGCGFLSALPESLGQLTRLTVLDLSMCLSLAVLPESLGQLTGLTTLNVLKCSMLAVLPNSLGQLTGLTALDLSWCQVLTALPELLGQLTGLTILNLSKCSTLAPLPESLGHLTGLTALDLSWCQALTALPELLGQLTGLTILNLSECYKLVALPESLGQLTRLTTLSLSSCLTLALPESLGQLTGLTTLNLSYCSKLAKLPESLGQLTGLTALDLPWCEALTALPESLGQLWRLTALDLSWCEALTALPESLGQLTRLTTLNLSKCYKLVELPESLGHLTGLKALSLEGCKALPALPESLGQLVGLKRLDLQRCMMLSTVPDSLRELTGLAIVT